MAEGKIEVEQELPIARFALKPNRKKSLMSGRASGVSGRGGSYRS